MENQRKTFLSYSRVNKDFALRLAKELKAEGFYVWLDQLDIPAGARWDREVEKALKECEIFMIIITQASIDSENVLDEIGYAIDKGKRILPVLLETCEVPLRLRRLQYVDFTNKNFDDGVESAKKLLQGLIEKNTIPKIELPEASNEINREFETASSSFPIREIVHKEEENQKQLPIKDKNNVVPKTTQKKKQINKWLLASIILIIVSIIGVFSVNIYLGQKGLSGRYTRISSKVCSNGERVNASYDVTISEKSNGYTLIQYSYGQSVSTGNGEKDGRSFKVKWAFQEDGVWTYDTHTYKLLLNGNLDASTTRYGCDITDTLIPNN